MRGKTRLLKPKKEREARFWVKSYNGDQKMAKVLKVFQLPRSVF